MHRRRVGAAFAVQEGDLLGAARAHRTLQGITIAVGEGGGIDVVALGRADPALLRQHDGHRLARHQLGLVDGLRGLALHQRRTAGVAELLGVGGQFVADQLLQLGLAVEDAEDLLALLGQLVLLAADLHLFQAGQLLQLGFQDVVSLVFGQAEARDQRCLRFVLGTDDVDHLVQVEEGHQQAFQQVQAALDLLQAVLQAAGDGGAAERQPFAEQHLQVLYLRTAVQPDHVEVDAVAALHVRGGEQVAHQLVGVDAVGARHQHHAHRVGVVGFIAHVFQPRQLLGAHLRGNLLDHLRRRHLERQRGDHHVVRFLGEGRTRTHAAVAGLVHRAQVVGRGDDLGGRRIVRALHVLAQVAHAGIGIVQQVQQRADDLVEVVRRHVGGHAHGDAGGAVQQQVRQARRHPGRFLQGAVEVRRPVGGALAQLAQQHFGDRGQLGFGVAHRRERLRVVAGAEVALALDQRVAVGERLRHQHQRLVARAVAMRVVLTDHVTDGARGLLRLGRGIQAQLAHRIDDAALHRLQAIADERQGTVEHHVHRIVEVGAFGVLAQRQLFETVEYGAGRFGHAALLPMSGGEDGGRRSQCTDYPDAAGDAKPRAGSSPGSRPWPTRAR